MPVYQLFLMSLLSGQSLAFPLFEMNKYDVYIKFY